MHIIKHGEKKLTKYEKPIIFSCLICNCRFEANPDEYIPPDDDNYRDGAIAKCPECGETAYEEFIPTIEAEPEVRRGRMIESRYPNENKCSECGQVFRDDIRFLIQDDDGVFRYPKRCPECGCYWDGGADNG